MSRVLRDRIGYMQGRLSPLVDGKIQAFPWTHWRDEFPMAEKIDLRLLEWTLDHQRLAENPLMTTAGRQEIASLSLAHEVSVVSLTGDIFMQAPFWKATGGERELLLREFDAVVHAAGGAGIRFIIVPLVDNGSLQAVEERVALVAELLKRETMLRDSGVTIAFESDFAPSELSSLIDEFPTRGYGINYDTGNSAALGFASADEIGTYANRIVNVHIKDRLLGGTTVPLGTGAAHLPEAVSLLERAGYAGNYILQTARATDGNHAMALADYRDILTAWIGDARGP